MICVCNFFCKLRTVEFTLIKFAFWEQLPNAGLLLNIHQTSRLVWLMIFLTLLSFVSPQVYTVFFFFLFHFLPFIRSRTQLQPLAMKLEMVFFRIQRLLRCIEKSDRGNSSEFSRLIRSTEDP